LISASGGDATELEIITQESADRSAYAPLLSKTLYKPRSVEIALPGIVPMHLEHEALPGLARHFKRITAPDHCPSGVKRGLRDYRRGQ
jgi:hypothetical protein